MLNSIIAAAAAPAAEAANPYGLMEALEQGGIIAWTVFIILVGMSVGTFYEGLLTVGCSMLHWGMYVVSQPCPWIHHSS